MFPTRIREPFAFVDLPVRQATILLMKHAVPAFLLLSAFATQVPAQPMDAHQLVAMLGEQACRTLWQFHPVSATASGCHDYDSLLGRYSAADVARFARRLKEQLKSCEQILPEWLTADEQIDHELLISNIRMELFRLEQVPSWKRNPQFYADECVEGVYYPLLRDFAPLEDRAGLAIRRLRAVPRVMAEAARNVKNPPATYAGAAIGELASGEEFFAQVARNLGEQFPDLKPALDLSSARAVKAMKGYQERLQKLLPGLADNFAMGKANYDYVLKTDQFFDFDSDSLLRIGEKTLNWSDSLIQLRAADKTRYDSLHPARADEYEPPPAGFSRADYLAYEDAEAETMRAWTAREFATVPEYVGDIRATETPGFLLGIIPGLAMEPPAPLDSVQTSYMYLGVLPDPFDSSDRERYWNTVRRHGGRGGLVHEGFPGHHLQLSLANHHPSLIRRMQGNNTLIEGWALYCEQAVTEQGLYPDDGFLSLRWLGGVRFRAARVILDVKLHTGQMTYDQAVQFMCENFGGDTAFFQGEVRRYCLQPTQPMSYLVGKTQILALRRECEERLGDDFSLRNFHDRLLAEGSIPVSLIRRKLLAD